MEIIDPRDITLVKFLGSGGYGDVHLGKWHSSEAAIKCLNPSLFFQVPPCIMLRVLGLALDSQSLLCAGKPAIMRHVKVDHVSKHDPTSSSDVASSNCQTICFVFGNWSCHSTSSIAPVAVASTTKLNKPI